MCEASSAMRRLLCIEEVARLCHAVVMILIVGLLHMLSRWTNMLVWLERV